jgi:hypothetical protein
MDSFKFWYFRNQEKINWFITGWLSLSFFNSLSRGDYVSAAISGGLIVINVALSR